MVAEHFASQNGSGLPPSVPAMEASDMELPAPPEAPGHDYSAAGYDDAMDALEQVKNDVDEALMV